MSETAGRLRERLLIAGMPARGDAREPLAPGEPASAAWAELVPAETLSAATRGEPAAGRRWRIRMRAAAAPKPGCLLRWRGRSLVVLASQHASGPAGITELIAEEKLL